LCESANTFSVNLKKNVYRCFHSNCRQGNVLDFWAALSEYNRLNHTKLSQKKTQKNQRPAARLSPSPKTNLRSRARQEADVKPCFLTGAAPNLTAPNLALLFADDATTAGSILARKRGIENFDASKHKIAFLPEKTLPRCDCAFCRCRF